MSSEANKTIVRRLIEEYFNGRDEAVWDELAHPDVVVHGVQGLATAAEAKAFYARLHAAFPDWHATIDDIFGEGDRVALRITESGTLQGSFPPLGLTATGKRFEISAIQICRLHDGKLVEMWGARDTGSMLRQLSGAPTAVAAG
jgi:predicted ester cyclase